MKKKNKFWAIAHKIKKARPTWTAQQVAIATNYAVARPKYVKYVKEN